MQGFIQLRREGFPSPALDFTLTCKNISATSFLVLQKSTEATSKGLNVKQFLMEHTPTPPKK